MSEEVRKEIIESIVSDKDDKDIKVVLLGK